MAINTGVLQLGMPNLALKQIVAVTAHHAETVSCESEIANMAALRILGNMSRVEVGRSVLLLNVTICPL